MIRLCKLLLLIGWVMLCFLPGWVCLKLKKTKACDIISHLCYRGMLYIIGVRLTVKGKVSDLRPLLLVSNHVSYLDIPVLGSAFPFRFTPKMEIASWPVISTLCRVTGAIFVDRRVEKLHQSLESIRQALARREVVSVFPEATTGNGIRVLPFKSGLFHLAGVPIDGAMTHVQPAAIVYTHLRGLPIDSCQWPEVAWYGDMTLVPHLWKLLGLGHIHATLVLLPPVRLEEPKAYKQLAATCQHMIAEAVQAARP